MKINGIDVSEQFLLSELSEWEGKLSELALIIAKRYGMGDKFTNVENVRKALSKLKNRTPKETRNIFTPFEKEIPKFTPSIVETIRSKYTQTLPVVYIVIGDLHEPYTHSEYLTHCIYVRDKWTKLANAQFGEGKWELRVIFIGDEVDNHALSYHEHNPNLASAGDELTMAKFHLQDWYKEFPKAIVTEGNHSLVPRKMFTAGIPKIYMRDIAEVLGTPNWQYVDEWIDTKYGILFTHGTNLSKTTITTKALHEQLSVICGHHHTQCSIEYVNQASSLFTMFVGCGINICSPAFAYAKGFSKKPILSCGVVFDGLPILEQMKEN